jgi:hypothetical protein
MIWVIGLVLLVIGYFVVMMAMGERRARKQARSAPGRVTIHYFADSPARGCGATVRFETGEPCILSIAQSGIRVKKSRSGLYGAVLYDEKNAFVNTQRIAALAYLFPDKRFPDGITSPHLQVFLNALLHCRSAAEACQVLNDAIPMAERKAGCALSELTKSDLPAWALPK